MTRGDELHEDPRADDGGMDAVSPYYREEEEQSMDLGTHDGLGDYIPEAHKPRTRPMDSTGHPSERGPQRPSERGMKRADLTPEQVEAGRLPRGGVN